MLIAFFSYCYIVIKEERDMDFVRQVVNSNSLFGRLKAYANPSIIPEEIERKIAREGLKIYG